MGMVYRKDDRLEKLWADFVEEPKEKKEEDDKKDDKEEKH